jgi:hypothetical protein
MCLQGYLLDLGSRQGTYFQIDQLQTVILEWDQRFDCSNLLVQLQCFGGDQMYLNCELMLCVASFLTHDS